MAQSYYTRMQSSFSGDVVGSQMMQMLSVEWLAYKRSLFKKTNLGFFAKPTVPYWGYFAKLWNTSKPYIIIAWYQSYLLNVWCWLRLVSVFIVARNFDQCIYVVIYYTYVFWQHRMEKDVWENFMKETHWSERSVPFKFCID